MPWATPPVLHLALDDHLIQQVAAVRRPRCSARSTPRRWPGRSRLPRYGSRCRKRRPGLHRALGVEPSGTTPWRTSSPRALGDLGCRLDAPLRAGNVEDPVAILNLVLGGLQQQRRDVAAFRQHRLDGAHDGAADHHGGTRRHRAETRHVACRIAVPDPDRIVRDAELHRRHMPEHREMSLSLRRRPDADLDRLMAAGKRERSCLLGHSAGDLEIAADADAAQLAGLLRLLAPFAKTRIVGTPQGSLEHGREVAAVVDVAEGGRVGILARLDQVAAADLGLVEAGLAAPLRRRGARVDNWPPAARPRDTARSAPYWSGCSASSRWRAECHRRPAGSPKCAAWRRNARRRSHRPPHWQGRRRATPGNGPLRSSASSAVHSESRPWLSLRKASERVETQWTGRPKAFAACSSATYSG